MIVWIFVEENLKCLISSNLTLIKLVDPEITLEVLLILFMGLPS
jgi:hypothetical protein